MPIKTNFIVNTLGQNTDLGTLIDNLNTNVVNIPATGTTTGIYSINYSAPTIITESNISATMDGQPQNGDQVFTFGPAVQTRTVIMGEGSSNGAAFSNDGITINPLGTTNVPSNSGSAVFWDGLKWVGAVFASGTKNVVSYDGTYWLYTGTTSLTSGTGWAWQVLFNGSIYVMAGGSGTGGGIPVGYSYDGLNWTVATGLVTSSSYYVVRWNGFAWLIGGTTSTYLYYSLNGISWTTATHSFTAVYDAAWIGDKWVACGTVGTSRVAYTFDRTGATGWTTATSSTIFGSSATRLCWNGKILVIQSNGTNTLGYSYNGIDWVGLGLVIYPALTYGYLSWNGKSFLSGGTNNTNGLAYSYNGINWVGLGTNVIHTPYNIAYNSRRPHSITFQRNIMIAGGRITNTIAYSFDGFNWVGLGSSVFTGEGRYATYNGRLWVMCGQGTNTLAVSPNGITWTGLGSSIFSGSGYKAIWNEYLSLWVVGGSGAALGNTMAYSYDGFTWILGTQIFPNSCSSIAYTSSLMVAVGGNNTNTFAYSIDGKTWIGLGNPFGWTNGVHIETNGSLWVANGITPTSTYNIVYSYDGLNWFNTGYSTAATTMGNIGWNGTIWVAGVGAAPMAYSYDGINWLSGTQLFTEGAGVCWNGTLWCATGGISSTKFAVSYDGINWTIVSTPTTIFSIKGTRVSSNYQVPPKPFIQHPTLAFGSGGNTIAYSPDGITWQPLGNNVFSTQANRGFWNGTIWVACGQGTNSLAYSYDGIQWIGLGTSIFTVANSVTYNGSIWVAVGSGTFRIAYSYDGLNWTGVTNSTQIFTTQGFGVAWNGTVFLATGGTGGAGGNSIATSTTGIIWSGVSTSYGSLTSYPYSNGPLWVVPNSGGAGLLTNTNRNGSGAWTTQATTVFTTSSFCVNWNGYIWVAGGTGGNTLAWSNNGTTWTGIGTSLFPGGVRDICWNGRYFIGIGTTIIGYSATGNIWYSTPFSNNFTNGNGVASNSGVGAFIAPSAIVLNNNNITGNGISSSQTLEIVSSDPYFQQGFQNVSINVSSSLNY